MDTDVARIVALCKECGVRAVRVARDEDERARLWQGRKKAFGAMGRVSSHLVVQDAVIPRTRLPEVLGAIAAIAGEERVTVCNVFHAGDGNLHPNIPYNGRDPAESARVSRAMARIMGVCIDAGGSVTGEHGIGLDKLEYMPRIFSDDSLDAMCRLRDAFDPERRANPGKVVPVRSCREWRGTVAGRGGTVAGADNGVA
jgi:FAD/FMN-containing dehydrogenase